MYNVYRISDSEKKVIAKAMTEADAIQICEHIGWNYSDPDGTEYWLDYEADADSKEQERLQRGIEDIYDALDSILTKYAVIHQNPERLYEETCDLMNEIWKEYLK
ncbi:MAG: hypothetical protein IKU44_04445 [Firmicutes bacterium]|nr:hypothetical protein [Bacillota bacterium]